MRQHRISNCRSRPPACGRQAKRRGVVSRTWKLRERALQSWDPGIPGGGSPPAALVSQESVSMELSPRLLEGGHWLFESSISLWHCFLDCGKNSGLESAALSRLDNDFYGAFDRRMEPKREKQALLILQPSGLPQLPHQQNVWGSSWNRRNGPCRASASAPGGREEDSGLLTSIQTGFLFETREDWRKAELRF